MRKRFKLFLNKTKRWYWNLQWWRWYSFIDGVLPKLSLAISVVGYLILFNDQIAHWFQYSTITGASDAGFLSTITRLRLVYFGLIFLGMSNLLFNMCKPSLHSVGKDMNTYIREALSRYTLNDYLVIHSEIERLGALTPDGKDVEDIANFRVDVLPENFTQKTQKGWSYAHSAYGNLLRNMLTEQYFRANRKFRKILVSCIVATVIGYFLLALPSIDLFSAIVMAMIRSA